MVPYRGSFWLRPAFELTMSFSCATGNVTVGQQGSAGGLVGVNNDTIVAAFATGSLSPGDRDTVKAALLAVGANKDLCAALETKGGFVEPPAKKK